MGIGLGPVARIVNYDPRWPRRFKEEKARILAAIGPWARSVEHVGSTAVPGLAAKPIIDILVGLRSLEDAKECITRLEAIGYEYIPEYEAIRPERRYFRKGPTESRTHHLHMVETSSGFFRNHILFRDGRTRQMRGSMKISSARSPRNTSSIETRIPRARRNT